MKNIHLILTLLLIQTIFISCGSEVNEIAPPEPVMPIPSAAQMDWHEMEMIAFLHFTTNTFTNKEWGYGDESPSIFNPTELDVDQWMTTLKEAGFKGVILTAKHHDGFCLWPSEYTEHDVANSPYKNGNGDIVKEVSEAAREHGLKFGVYLSPWDRNHADYGDPSYIDYYRNQLEEIFTDYGPVFEMWFDGANGGDGYYGGANETRTIDRQTYYDWPTTIDFVRELQPEPKVLFFSDAGPDIRWVGNEHGVVAETNWNTINNDTLYAGQAGINDLLATGSEDGTKWIPAEVDVSIRPGWFYHPEEDDEVKSPEKLFEIYMTSVGRGSTLLLNIPPDRRGLLHENDVAALKEWRTMLDETFSTNIAAGAEVTADSYRGEFDIYHPNHITDDDHETYWTTGNGIPTGVLEIDLGDEKEISYVVLQEYIRLGQRIRSFSVDVWQNDEWQNIAEATTMGYKRILDVGPVTTNRIRININDSKASPIVSNVEVY
ncbi:alpha-L-fucosidase [Rhodohalobacter sp. 614A]|uniref:alpha-L-fucosidase n=1 Tax=Rhodohalobacter sp. 614A TaxID=2908649 RepID=UPI001F27DE5B|nr:alpha-L-fucosidase [Rhodohalobacter sp. 614A]